MNQISQDMIIPLAELATLICKLPQEDISHAQQSIRDLSSCRERVGDMERRMAVQSNGRR